MCGGADPSRRAADEHLAVDDRGDVDVHRLDDLRRESEPVPGHGHAQALMPALEVVLAHPRIQLALRVFDRREHLAVQELTAKCLVEPLDLAGRGR